MKMFGYELPTEDSLDWHKMYIIGGDDVYWLMSIENILSKNGMTPQSDALNKIIKELLDHPLEEDEEDW